MRSRGTGMMVVRIFAIFLGLSLYSLPLQAKVEETQPKPLGMFLVHSEEKPGTYYFSNEEFSDLGFIHSDPDLLIEKIDSVRMQIRTDEVITVDPVTGARKKEYVPRRLVIIVLTERDSDKMAALTKSHIRFPEGSRILFMVGDRPVYAPTVRKPIESGVLVFPLASRAQAKAITEELEAFVGAKAGSAEEEPITDWRDFSPSNEALEIVEYLGWVEMFSNIPFISGWEELTDGQRKGFENTAEYNLIGLKHSLAAWIDKEFSSEHRKQILHFLDAEAGRNFWERLMDRAQRDGLSYEDLTAWFKVRHSEKWDLFGKNFPNEHRMRILEFLDSEAGGEFWRMLTEGAQGEWSLFEYIGDFLDERHNERWDFLEKN